MVREIGLALVTAGFVVLLFVVYELVGTNLSEEHSQAQLARAFSAAVAGAGQTGAPGTTTPSGSSGKTPPGSSGKKGTPGPKGSTGPGTTSTTRPATKAPRHAKNKPRRGRMPAGSLPVPPSGGALDHMVIPAIGVDRYVVQGVGELDLQMGPGHYPGTPLPGQDGNVGIAGHRTTFGAPFFRLNEIVRGDYIYLTDISGTTWVYDVVRQWVVPPTGTGVLDASHRPELTLTTCNPRFEATTRLIVRAVLVEGIPRGTPLPGRLPVSAPRPTTTSRTPATSRSATTSRTPTSRASTVPTSANKSSTVPSTSTSAPGPPGGSGTGSAGPDSPTVGPGTGSVNLSGGGAGVWEAALGWGALALVGWVVTRVLAGRRYSYYAAAAVLVCGALVCLVPLWFAFANVVDLLPANL